MRIYNLIAQTLTLAALACSTEPSSEKHSPASAPSKSLELSEASDFSPPSDESYTYIIDPTTRVEPETYSYPVADASIIEHTYSDTTVESVAEEAPIETIVAWTEDETIDSAEISTEVEFLESEVAIDPTRNSPLWNCQYFANHQFTESIQQFEDEKQECLDEDTEQFEECKWEAAFSSLSCIIPSATLCSALADCNRASTDRQDSCESIRLSNVSIAEQQLAEGLDSCDDEWGHLQEYEVYGCMDPLAPNYDPSATSDDGTCEYVFGCSDLFASNYDPSATSDDGTCDYTFLGCMDPLAPNYDPSATSDDGTCEYVFGCSDLFASNYDPSATSDDGTCDYTFLGCMDPLAPNYDPSATSDDGTCEYVFGCSDLFASNYDPSATSDDGTCDYTFLGCMDPLAPNYDPSATSDDGTCEYVFGCSDLFASNYDPSATSDDGTCD